MERGRTLQLHDPMTSWATDSDLVVPLRPVVLIRSLCQLFGVRVDMAQSFAPIARTVLVEAGVTPAVAPKPPDGQTWTGAMCACAATAAVAAAAAVAL